MDKLSVEGTPPTGTASRTDGAATRLEILAAARRRLVESGYARLNVRDIARDAGVNHGLIRYHFGGKHQLVMAVLDDANARLLERQACMFSEEAPTSVKWKRACGFYDDDIRSGFVALLMELMGASFHDAELRSEFVPRLLAWHELVRSGVDEFLENSGVSVPVSAAAIASWIGWFWMGMEASHALGVPEEAGHQRAALEAMSVVLRRIEDRAAAGPATRGSET